MSPHRFRVELMLGRTLSKPIDAPDEATAMAIAEFLYKEYGDRAFEDSGESLIDTYINTSPEVV
jgi:hypothetical protein